MNIDDRIDNIKSLRTDSGLFLASSEGVETGYDKAWLRDNFYISLGLEAAAEWELVDDLWRAIVGIFCAHEDKIDWAAKNEPEEGWQYIHARYNPQTFGEFWEEWGNKQHDAVGAVLFKLGQLQTQGREIITDDDHNVIQRLVEYLQSVEYWHDPDNGVWEEEEEVHASSIGACVAGLRSINRLDFIDMPDGLIAKGDEALERILPRESEGKFCDLAQLSLMYPYDLISDEHAEVILERTEYHLARDKGVIRYKLDEYYNRNEDGYSEEAEWCFGFPWLAIIHAERGNDEKAQHWLKKAEGTVTEQGVPELYYSNTDQPNENNPLGWAESMLAVALSKIGS